MNEEAGPSDPKQPKATKKCVKLFRSEWLSLPEFNGWLAEHTTTEAKCKACGVVVKCGKSDLLKHSKTAKHLVAMKLIGDALSISAAFEKGHAENDPVKTAGIKLAALFATHNVAFEVADHLVPLLKEIKDQNQRHWIK